METKQLTPAQVALVQRLKTKDWGHGILSNQDMEFIYSINSLTDLQMMFGNPRVKEKFNTILSYLETYGMPEGFKERLDLWDEFEDYLYDENLLGLIDD